MSIGDNIKAAREAHRMSGPRLAQAAGISASALWNYERGNTTPSEAKLRQIADALQMEVSELQHGRKRRAHGFIRIVFPEGRAAEAAALREALRVLGVPMPKRVLRLPEDGPTIFIESPAALPG